VTASLPIDAVLPALLAALSGAGQAVLQAPPGAGKTTRVPLAILDAGLSPGRIVMLEPRRLAARAAAERMAATLGEAVGRTVGYRMRGETRVSAATRIEVVTEGILTRLIQDDPGLSGIGVLIFDEFHERSLNADLGLALALEIRGALRPDLRLLVMSATLDAAPVAAHLGGAPLVTAEGRAFPVETRWLPRPLPPDARREAEAARLIAQALDAVPEGALLAFLPGEGEIRRVAAVLAAQVPPGVVVRPLFGAMDFAAQRAAIAEEPGRKVVLATAIAETALTIPGVRVVVDAGLARRARFDPGSGMTRLVTERVTRAEAEQRRGRAGRVAPGVCYRLWARAEEGALAAFPPPEIAAADLTGLALELAAWGAADLPFLTPPPAPALAEARALLAALGALDAAGGITAHGRALAGLPLHPRLAHLLVAGGGPRAATVAALLAERDPLRGAPPDLDLRLAAIRQPGDAFPVAPDRAAIDRIRTEAKRLSPHAGPDRDLSPGALAALAYPDRIGLRRSGEAPRWLLSGGRGAAMEPGQPLSGAPMLVATDLDGPAREARVRQAAALDRREFANLFADRLTLLQICKWDDRAARVTAREQTGFGALILDDRPWTGAPPAALAQAAREGLRALGLPWPPAALRLAARIRLARAMGEDLPDPAEAAILADPEDALLPHLAGRRTAEDLRALDTVAVLRDRLGWAGAERLDRLVPAAFITPLGRAVPIDYDGEHPGIEARLPELYGVTTHPSTAGRPLRITLLSPGGKPVAVTTDLPGFWAGAYAEVRKEMRGRYPRHPWPEDPRAADPTTRAKPRGT
jgi:ATP-dependent helicase HrpB